MKTTWLNKQNNKNLIVFFTGWSFDENPFKNMDYNGFDVLFVYDYSDMNLVQSFDFSSYEEKILITWSMGVFIGYKLRNLFSDFDYKIAINGTVTPVDDEFGIPVKVFELTLKHSNISLRDKFYKNVFHTQDEYEKYLKNPVARTIENRVSELENLYYEIKNTKICYEKFYDYALVGEFDKIIPPKNQIASNIKNNIPHKILPYGHHLFYNFSDMKEILHYADRI